MYPAELVKPMREDLTSVGFTELHTTDEAREFNWESKTAGTLIGLRI